MFLKMGLTTTVVVSSCDAAREAFTRHDRRLAARTIPDMSCLFGISERSMVWLPSSNQRWKTMRGIVATHIFSPRSLASVRAIRERKVRDLVNYIRDRVGQEIDVGQAVYGGILNLVSTTLFSVDVIDVGAQSAHGLQEAVEELIELIAKPNVSDLFPFLRPLDLQGRRRQAAGLFEKLFQVLDDIIDRRLALAKASSSKSLRGDFLDALIQLTSSGTITREDMRTVMFDVFAAGSDTMAITVVWAMAELLHNPSIMSKVCIEIKEVLGSKETIEEPDVAGMPYFQAMVKEAMRLHPVAPVMLPHQAVEDGVEIGGYAVPKGSTIIFNAWAIMRDPAAWDRPDEFVPERFLVNRGAGVDFRGKDFEFIPFGSGRRMCPGLPMAERVVPLLLASLLHEFEWKLPNGMSAEHLDMSEKFTTSNVMTVPLKAVPVANQCMLAGVDKR
ncbi:hypothetical protein PR202_ga21211 [Eleusine coracana subsp. coracana]|uniref:Uncharacterized protein n=1 Tax=Eleusine coracana subsp. coracana TaxID=191504 RepID=A0AAV5D0F3_ELECO|nr:hypothetical protein PR202_ga21211 [Eleusine coracana subsp. coracana]